jgi:hypothetical protein
LGVTENAQETIWQYRRSAGFVLGYGIYQSFFDLHGGYFDDPALMAEVRRLNLLLADAKNCDCSSVAEILVVSDEVSCSYATFESGLLQQILRPVQVQLAKLGAPHDSILVDDLAVANLSRYRFVIFLNCFHLTDTQRRLIRKRVLNRNRTILWCYAPGMFNGAQTSIDAVRELTGLRLAPASNPDRVQARISLKQQAKQLGSDADSSPPIVGHEHVWAPLISVQDDSAVALGTLAGRSEVVLATKSMSSWTSVYTLNPVLPASLLRSFARRAGAHIYSDHDDTLYASRSFLTLAVNQRGRRRIRLPRRSDVCDPFTGQRLFRRVSEFEREFRAKETVIWQII